MPDVSTGNERRTLAVVTVIHAAVGSWVAALTPGPLLVSDDLAYLGMARTLAGQGAAPLAEQPPYGVLYPALLAPGWALGLDEPSMLVWARVLNGLLGAAVVPVLYFVVRRLTGATGRWSLVAAVVGASLPAHMSTASIVWTERLLPLLVVLSVLCLIRFADRPSIVRAIAVTGVAAALFAGHPRMGACALVTVLAVPCVARFGRLVRRRQAGPVFSTPTAVGVAGTTDAAGAAGFARPAGSAGSGTRFGVRNTLVVGAVGLMGLAAVEWVRRFAADAAFASSGTYDIADLAQRRGWDEIPEMVIRGTGTVGYLVLATAGLAVIGVVVLLRSPPVGPWVFLQAVAVAVVAGWFLTGVQRADAYLHGRYIEVMAPVLVSLGIIGLARMRALWAGLAMAVAIVASGVWGAWAGPGDNWSEARSPVMMLGTEAGGAPFGNDVFEPGAAAFVALAVGVVLLIAFRRPQPWLGLSLAIGSLALGTASDLEALDQLYETAALSTVQEDLGDIRISHIAVDVEGLSRNLTGAVAWEVGFDNTSIQISTDKIHPNTSHLLLRADAAAPANAELVADVGSGKLWALPR
ncbi:MAG: hypothetical protein OXF75_09785 [Acidimicrobiaceae bacterium]|nr:hypothetical protein [Acidimicrobiaceae bacterium]